jgi:hypothetical protein
MYFKSYLVLAFPALIAATTPMVSDNSTSFNAVDPVNNLNVTMPSINGADLKFGPVNIMSSEKVQF